MIFVSMKSSELLSRTSQYQMRDPSPPPPNDEFEPLISDDANENRPLSRRRDSATHRTIPPPISNIAPRSVRHSTTSTATSTVFPHIDHGGGNDIAPVPRASTPPEAPAFTVTASCNEPSSDEEEPSSAATLADRSRRDRLPQYDPSSDEDTEDGLERAIRRARNMGASSSHGHRRSRRRAEPSRIEVVIPPGVVGEKSVDGETKDVLAPHAKFFIERERSVVSVKFDPPVYGDLFLGIVTRWSVIQGAYC